MESILLPRVVILDVFSIHTLQKQSQSKRHCPGSTSVAILKSLCIQIVRWYAIYSMVIFRIFRSQDALLMIAMSYVDTLSQCLSNLLIDQWIRMPMCWLGLLVFSLVFLVGILLSLLVLNIQSCIAAPWWILCGSVQRATTGLLLPTYGRSYDL